MSNLSILHTDSKIVARATIGNAVNALIMAAHRVVPGGPNLDAILAKLQECRALAVAAIDPPPPPPSNIASIKR